jgi:pimeloyl-ACP methyl ester carboxylesterase
MMDERPKSTLSKPIGKSLLLFFAGLYFLVCLIMAIAQRSLEYHPHVYDSAQVDRIAQSANLERWTNSDGANIGFKRLSPTHPAIGSILITYGNAGSATGCAHYVNDIQNVAAMDVYILEYPGYEDRTGHPAEKTFFAAAADAFQIIPTNKPVYLLGESLGSGVASYLAGTFTNRIDGIVLLSPFPSITDVGQHRYPFLPVSLLLVDKFASEKYLRNYHGKVAVTVDGRDDVVPEKFGLRLYNSYEGPKKLWSYPNGGHIEIYLPHTKFWKEAIAFWRDN